MSGVKVESVDTRCGWLLGATFNDAAILEELNLHVDDDDELFDIDAIQDECLTCDVLDDAIHNYCVEIKSIMNKMLCGTTYVPGDDAKDAMNDAWGELLEIVKGLSNKIKNEIYINDDK